MQELQSTSYYMVSIECHHEMHSTIRAFNWLWKAHLCTTESHVSHSIQLKKAEGCHVHVNSIYQL